MRAIVADPLTHELDFHSVEDPNCGGGEVLIDIHATSVNRADLLQRAGKYPPPPGATDILGLDCAGIVTNVGPGVKRWKIGDRVCALLPGGGYAEKVAVHESLILPIPQHWTFAEGGAFPEVFLTAFVNIFIEASAQRKESVLIHSGASGVGSAAIQLVVASGSRAFATAGTQQKRDFCISLGAERAVEHYHSDFAADLLQYTEGVDVILDVAGAKYLEKNMRLLNTGGRLIIISLLSGSKAEIDLSRLMLKRIRIVGSTLRSRPLEEKAAIVRAFEKRFWSIIESGKVAPVVDRILPIERAAEAHEILKRNENIGKVVLSVR
ncbi:MAG: NAD(P)H-quinone oxidoreductase [Planctomycetota bacterium]